MINKNELKPLILKQVKDIRQMIKQLKARRPKNSTINLTQEQFRMLITAQHIQQLRPISNDPKKVQYIRAQFLRQKQQYNFNRNQSIFYKKKGQSISRTEKNESNKQIEKLRNNNTQTPTFQNNFQDNKPFFLRKRRLKTQKQFSIIQHNYNSELKIIKQKQKLRRSLQFQDKKKLIKNMKGSKLYYKFIKQWNTSND